jgi:hypothetical protein
MSDVEKLYSEIEESGIIIVNERFKKANVKALSSFLDDGDCFIAIDEAQCDNPAEIKTALLHERGIVKRILFTVYILMIFCAADLNTGQTDMSPKIKSLSL